MKKQFIKWDTKMAKKRKEKDRQGKKEFESYEK